MAEADPKLTMKISKIKNNRLLDRVQMIVNVYYDPKVKVTRQHIVKKLVEKFKKPHVSVFGMKKVLGGGRTKCFALVYDSDDSLKKFEPKARLARMELEKKEPKARKFVKTKEARKIVKVRKHQLQRKRATKRRQDINLDRKQKKKK
jgi:small subunit ribosomal protein S24e